MHKLIIFLIFISVVSISAQTNKQESLSQIQQNLHDSYKNGKLDDALKFANKALEICIKEFGSTTETATAYVNLATVQTDKKKYKESAENFQKAVNIYENSVNPDIKNIADILSKVAFSHFLAGNTKDAEASYLRAFQLMETKFGLESKESLAASLNLANFYVRNSKVDTADKFYLKSYSIVVKNFGYKSERIEQIDDIRSCMINSRFTTENKRDEFKAFETERSKILNEQITENESQEDVVNGKAKILIKPPYPEAAKNLRLQGIVPIKVTIDEQGNVIKTKAVCGEGILENASIEAAKKSKFSPTFLNKTAVKVTGIIIYKFTAM